MKRIFIIEDDESLRRELAYVLELEGYNVSTCTEFSHAAEDALGKKPDTIVLDLRLPGADGLAICRRIRENSNVPILVLTSSDEEFDEVMSMKLGADGYLLKPYRPAVLLAHIARLLERSDGDDSGRIEYAGIMLDTARSQASFDMQAIGLTRNETCILAALIRARGAIVSRQDLMFELWQTDEFVDDNTLTVNVNRLRRSLSCLGAPSDTLKTHRRQGYSL